LISKPPAAEVAYRILAAAAMCEKPVVAAFIGAPMEPFKQVRGAATLEQAARLAVHLAYGKEADGGPLRTLPGEETVRLAPGQRYVRGLYSGGTLCYEALVLLRSKIGPIFSNTPLRLEEALDPVTRSREHTIIDMGGDEFTQGRLHPMLDPMLRLQRLRAEAADPQTAVLLLDIVLGYGAHANPSAAFGPVIDEMRGQALAAGRSLTVIGSVCGTDDDPQHATDQRDALTEAGMLVEDSNARAARVAGLIAEARGSHGRLNEPQALRADGPIPPWPAVDAVSTLLSRPPSVVNIGLELFAESLQAQGVPVVSVDWQPPASGKQHLLDLLDKLEG
jgi:FdrA protein